MTLSPLKTSKRWNEYVKLAQSSRWGGKRALNDVTFSDAWVYSSLHACCNTAELLQMFKCMSWYFIQICLVCAVISVHVVLQIPNDKSEVHPNIFETTHVKNNCIIKEFLNFHCSVWSMNCCSIWMEAVVLYFTFQKRNESLINCLLRIYLVKFSAVTWVNTEGQPQCFLLIRLWQRNILLKKILSIYLTQKHQDINVHKVILTHQVRMQY
jgi:hypothetical protein